MALIRPEGRELGDLVFLKLDDYEPAWRQAAVVHKLSQGGKLILAVRVLESEIAEVADQVTWVQVKGQKFLMVEGKVSQTRDSCAQPHRALEIGVKPLVDACKAKMESEDLHFVTASEDLAPEVSKKLMTGLSSESSDVESDDDEIFSMLKTAKRNKQDRATGSADKPDMRGAQTQRYPLLGSSSKHQASSQTRLEKLLERGALEGGGDATGASISALVNLELLKMLKGKKKGRVQLDRDLSSADDSEQSTSDSQESKKMKGAGRALRDFRYGHRKMKRKPLKHVRKYVREVEAHLGVTPQSPYRLSDYSRRLSWGKQKSLMRIHYAVSELLQVLLKGGTERAALMAVQLLRAIHQVCLDQGSWQAASLLLSHVDPLERPKFGGEPDQLERIASYIKAMNDLEKRNQNVVREDLTAPPKGRGRGKGKKSEEETEQ